MGKSDDFFFKRGKTLAATPAAKNERTEVSHAFKGHVPSLDGLRALAVMSVMAVHSGVPGFQSGWIGVDFFFALSGYLITTLLLQEFYKRGQVSLRNFFVRRLLRLMPAYLIYITGITAAMWCWSGSILSTHGGWSPELYTISLWAYFVNYAPQAGIWNGQDITIHLWSLAVEEQYYLIWPALLIACLTNGRYLLPVAWGGALITLAIFIGWANDIPPRVLYTRGTTLFIASAMAVTIWVSSTGKLLITNAANSNWLLTGIVVVTCIVFVVGAAGVLSEAQIRYYFIPWLSFGFVLIVIRCALTDAWMPSLLTHPWLVQTGRISYGLYLYHEITRVSVWFITKELLFGLPKYLAYGLRLTIFTLLTLLLAWLSYRFLELPFLQLKKRFRA